MKTVVVKLKKNEIKFLKPVCEKIQSCQNMVVKLSGEVLEREKTLWNYLRKVYPECSEGSANYNYEKYELTYKVSDEDDKQLEILKELKEKAIKEMDFEAASRYRNEEAKLREKIVKKNKES